VIAVDDLGAWATGPLFFFGRPLEPAKRAERGALAAGSSAPHTAGWRRPERRCNKILSGCKTHHETPAPGTDL